MKIVIAFLLTFSCLANFTGKWNGEGYYQTPKRVGECLEVFMQFEIREDSFSIIEGGYICGEIQARYPTSRFTISNGNLFYFDEKVGTIANDEINIRYEDGLFHLSLKKVDGQIIFHESWNDGEDHLIISSKLNLLL